jgi:hypothetical protein
MEEMRIYTQCLSEKLGVRNHLEDTCIDRRMILRLILKKKCVRVCIGLIWLGIENHDRLL